MTTAAGANHMPSTRLSDDLSPEKLIDMLRMMMLIRRFEERTAQNYQQANIGGFCHLYNGQEASAVGAIAALKDDDPIITAYRDHGHALARGMHPKYCMAEMFGKLTGCAKGKGGSMHMFDRPHHMYGGHAIVGGQVPMGVGLAFAIQYEGKDNVCLCFLGDGALNQGAFHEAMNLAAIWNLPIIFICENNSYSMGTHIARGTSAADDLSVKAAAYGMRYAQCDGMDALNVYDCIKAEVDRARGSTSKALGRDQAGEGPCFVNMVTYRYKGHSMSDPQKYRSKDEVNQYEDQDPIGRMQNALLKRGLVNQEQLDDFDRHAKEQAMDAVKFAQESPDTPLEEMYTDVYVNPFGPFKKGDLPQMLRENDNDNQDDE